MLCLVGGIRKEWKRREENVIFHCVDVVKREEKENEVDEAFYMIHHFFSFQFEKKMEARELDLRKKL